MISRIGVLSENFRQLRGDPQIHPDASIVVPINAQADVDNFLLLLTDIAAYRGKRSFEVVLIVNNYPPEVPPPAIDAFRNAGLKVISIPDLRQPGIEVHITARIHGLHAAATENAILFDADCRIPNATALLDWYVEQFQAGAQLAYTHVGYYDLRPGRSVRVRIWFHHLSRWFKRAVLGVPTSRGSNYGVKRAALLQLYEQRMLVSDMSVGPNIKAKGGRIAYSGAKDLIVLTSGRKIEGGWGHLIWYLGYRLGYNLRVLPVRPNAARYTKKRW